MWRMWIWNLSGLNFCCACLKNLILYFWLAKCSMRATMLALNQITIMSLFQIECTYLNALDEQEVTARVFMPLSECPSKRCTVNKAKGNLILQLRASKFLKFQEVCLLHYILITISNLQHNCFTFLILV